MRLNPAPSDISNKVFNLDMILLKEKFLNQFKLVIKGFGEDIENSIYNKHLSEVIKYINDVDKVIEYFSDFNVGFTSVLQKSITKK
ncbi:hypothetical protein D3C84_957380 [compost metagenome]